MTTELTSDRETPPVVREKKSIWTRWWMIVIYIALPGLLLFIALRPAAVFSWDGDDLGEWVTEDEMTVALEEVVSRYAGTDPDGSALLNHSAGDTDWEWDLEGWRVIAHNGDHSPEGGVVEPTHADTRLPQGVRYEALSGFAYGFYGLSGPNSDETLCIALFPPGTGFGYPKDSEADAYEDMLFALASIVLGEMGWAEAQNPAP